MIYSALFSSGTWPTALRGRRPGMRLLAAFLKAAAERRRRRLVLAVAWGNTRRQAILPLVSAAHLRHIHLVIILFWLVFILLLFIFLLLCLLLNVLTSMRILNIYYKILEISKFLGTPWRVYCTMHSEYIRISYRYYFIHRKLSNAL